MKLIEVHGKNLFARMQHDVQRLLHFRQMLPDCRPHPATDPVTLHSSTQYLAYRESHPRT